MPARTTSRTIGAVAGILAAGAALAMAELASALLDDTRSLVLSVGDWVIDSVPGWLERAAIATLGTADKPVLVGGILVVSAVFGALLGIVATRRFIGAALGFVVFAILGAAAAGADPQSNGPGPLLAGLVGAAAGMASLWILLSAAPAKAAPAPSGVAEPAVSMTTGGRGDRRRFLGVAGAVAAVTAMAVVAGRLLVENERINRIREAIGLPAPARRAGPVPPDADLEIAGLTPLFIPNDGFFRIDTALTIPQVDPASWTLEVGGLVDRPFTLTYDELLAMPHVEADITLACVSNEVGGGLVGNARWQGVPLRVLLERAGVQEGGTQVVGRSVDGFSAGFPTVAAFDVQDALVAVGMNGEPLPTRHGFPARLVVPGLYGYVSATKWLSKIELAGWDDVDGYWIPRGWAKEGPIKTQSRIDVPRPGSTIPAGETVIAGVAWAPTRGIERVEVSIDEGAWQEAVLATSLDVDCWRQWYLPWVAEPGSHALTVRATDGRGEVQTDQRTPVAPDGAAGHHRIDVAVSGA